MIPTFYRRGLVGAAVLAIFAAHARAQTYAFTTLAGHASYGSDAEGYGAPSGNADGQGDAARFYVPSGITRDNSGNLIVADTFNCTIRKITPSGVVTTVAGLAGSGGGADGIGSVARFFRPQGVAVDAGGNIFVADSQNCTIRKITPDGMVTTIAGPVGGTYGKSDGFGSADGIGNAALFRGPLGLTLDNSGNLYVVDTGNHTIRKITPAGLVTTMAGVAGSSGASDGSGTAARFNFPTGVAIDAGGNVFVADNHNNEIRKITADGNVTTFAGNAAVSLGGVDGIGSAARFDGPQGLAFDASGSLFVADAGNGTVRKITTAGIVTTVAGMARSNGSDPNSFLEPVPRVVDSPGIGARFNFPSGLTVDPSGAVFVADSNNNLIRKIAADGAVTTLAGAGTSNGSADGAGSIARFNFPRSVAADGNANIFIADTGSHTIRKIGPDGVVTTLAGQPGYIGGADGSGSAARFSYPYGLAADSSGNVFVADTHNHTIRKITSTGVVTTLAGQAGVSGNVDGVASAARFNFPEGVAVDRSGNVFVADGVNGAIRKITANGIVTTVAATVADSNAAFLHVGQAVAVDSAGVVYFVDGNRIRKLALDGTVTTLAGSGPIFDHLNDTSYARTDGPPDIARFTAPTGLSVDSVGNVFVADGTIRMVRPDGYVTTIGSGFLQASGVAVDRNGAVFVTDYFNNTLARGVLLANSARLINVSVLAVLAGGDTLTMGTIIGGVGTGGTKPLLARAAGPSLAPFGVTNFLTDPKFEFFTGTTKINENDDWGGAASLSAIFAQVGAFPFASQVSKDAALYLPSVLPANNTVRVSGNGAAGGTVLAELYDATPTAAFNSTPRLVNVSVLKNIGSGLTAGFIIGGIGTKTVLIRAVGPSLAVFGVGGLLADPKLELFDGQSHSIATNDNWGEAGAFVTATLAATFAQVGAFVLSGPTSKDAALLVTLTPGNYTVQVRSADSTTGVALVEVYEVP